jgi:hypothetical protein
MTRFERKAISRFSPIRTALLPAPFWCTYAWNRPTSTGAGGSDPLWLCWRGKPISRSAGEATPRPSGVNWNDN